jgi:DNA-binding IscR family transcriptional regulator
LLAVQSLVITARAYSQGGRAPNELELAESLGCSSVVLKSSLDGLEQAGIIIRGDSRDMPILLMRAPETISVADVQEAVFKKRESMFLGRAMLCMYQCFIGTKSPEKMSLKDLVSEYE